MLRDGCENALPIRVIAMNLEELTALENEWLEKQPATGYIEERDALYKQIGMYEAWQDIFRQYVTLAREGEREALKRALFLYWYGCSEPHWLNGILGLDDELAKEVLGMVNDLAKKDELDTELKWMLPWYYCIAEWYLDRFDGFDELKKASKGNPFLYKKLCLESSFDNRGQLGEYWKSIQNNLTGKIDKDKQKSFTDQIDKIWKETVVDDHPHCRELRPKEIRAWLRLITGRRLPSRTEGLRAILNSFRGREIFVTFQTDEEGCSYILDAFGGQDIQVREFVKERDYELPLHSFPNALCWQKELNIVLFDPEAIEAATHLHSGYESPLVYEVLIDKNRAKVYIYAERQGGRCLPFRVWLRRKLFCFEAAIMVGI